VAAHENFDVVIVGGSFAGLAVATQLRPHRVLLVDQHPIGSHQMSACGTPLQTVQAVGAEGSIQAVHRALVLHTNKRAVRFPLRHPFVTFDYRRFCQAVLAQTDADVWRARVTAMGADFAVTTQGRVQVPFVVDASGWRSQSNAEPTPHIQRGYGLETELPLRWDDPGLHFYIEKALVANGYAWIFPCGQTTRFGVGSFEKDLHLRPVLVDFLSRYNLSPGDTHGGVLAITPRTPVVDGIFRVGDAAGHCLSVSGEGIRTAIFHGLHCGRAIAGVLAGAFTRPEAEVLYRLQVRGNERFQARLLTLQALVARTPEWLLALAGQICASRALTHRIMDRYLAESGWFAAAPELS
jgi:flavin-dependent dehydrogenase